jgi:hypothetical protein
MDDGGSQRQQKISSRGIGEDATREEKRALNRKLQRVSRLKENAEREGTMMKIDSMFAT